jgi:predicted AlkP superfamily phosphohydrolase/phosphomutase
VKLVVIGLDAADWNVINPLLKENKLPHLRSLMRSGSYGRLKTLAPAQSPVVWNSIATGKTPKKHGIRGFVVRHPETGKRMPYTSNMRKCKAIWDILSDYGKRVGVVGWWNTWPATPVNGAMVCGVTRYKLKDFEAPVHARGWVRKQTEDGQTIEFMEAPRKSSLQPHEFNQQTYPESLFQEIQPLIRQQHRVDDAPAFIRRAWASTETQDEMEQMALRLLLQIHNDDRTYAEIGKYLLERLRPDFLAVYLAGVDVVGHKFWIYMEPEKFDVAVETTKIEKYKDVLRDYYCFVDELIGEYLGHQDENTCVAIVSDHGMSASQRAVRVSQGAGSADHTDEDGVIILSGKYIKRDHHIPRASVLDVTPTLLALMGLPVGADMDGRVLKSVFQSGFFEQHPLRYIPTYDLNVRADDAPIESPMDEEILERLRALGYIE